ncbi:3-phosphoshikimate 1-carboxyvinyltransferase [Robertkochia aurantiaca]|uniref:3-phosphoshikimate 1-carboxyvinyltransferase n=1 Tax=Robertkochia aurantiaca TaxID=2873700 RepID=UPI001CCEAB03
MNINISARTSRLNGDITITGSKSETNRLLLLQALYPQLTIANISNSDDALVMQKGLKSSASEIDIHHAGTAMRFLTAYFATQPGRNIRLTGSRRMTERPIGILVEALRELGADISYENEEGYPPLLIQGKRLQGNKVTIPADVSSQYISALLLIAPSLPEGLMLELKGKITSVPYIKMTLSLLDRIGVPYEFKGNLIRVQPKTTVEKQTLVVESDWSSASYFYSIAALSESASISLSSYRKDSLQGDSVLSEIYRHFGVETSFKGDGLHLSRSADAAVTDYMELDLSNAPDIAQTIAVTCFGLGIGCRLTGLHTLKIKETDRLEALKAELSKFGAQIEVTDKELMLQPSGNIQNGVSVATYNDHRMAMAFAPLALKVPLSIQDAGVVSKSYPDFWNDLEVLGFTVEKI